MHGAKNTFLPVPTFPLHKNNDPFGFRSWSKAGNLIEAYTQLLWLDQEISEILLRFIAASFMVHPKVAQAVSELWAVLKEAKRDGKLPEGVMPGLLQRLAEPSIHSFVRFSRFDSPEDRADLVQMRSAQQDILVDMYCIAAGTAEAQLVLSTLLKHLEKAEANGDAVGVEVVWYAFQGIAEVIVDEPNVPDAFHAVLRSVVGAAPVEVSSTAAALLRACGPHFEKDLQLAWYHYWVLACSMYARAFPDDLPKAAGQPISLASGLLHNDPVSRQSLGSDHSQNGKPKTRQSAFPSDSAGPRLPGESFDEDILEHSMQLFAEYSKSNRVDLQVDWSLPGMGCVANNTSTTHNPSNDELASPDRFTVGQRVLLSRLNMTELNGKVGVIIAAPCSLSSRYGVKLESGRRVALRASNMTLVGGAAESPSTASKPQHPEGSDLICQHAAMGTEPYHDSQQHIFHPGQSVCLTGLSDDNYNGSVGCIATALTSTGRYGVKLPCGRHIAVRPCNLKVTVNDGVLFCAADLPSEKHMELNTSQAQESKEDPFLWSMRALDVEGGVSKDEPFRFPAGTAKPYSY
eukprot:s71_g6.t1